MLAQLGREHGVAVSVVSIRGDDIKMDALGVVANGTGGSVDIVDATSLQNKMDSLSAPIVATNVTVTARCSNNVVLFDASSGATGVGGVLSSTMPSVKTESDVFFSLQVPKSIDSVFVQIELTWTALDGSVFSRVLNREVKTSTDRDAVEKQSNLALSSIVALRECATLAADNKVEDGIIVLISTMRLLQRGMASVESQQVFLSFVKQAERLDGFLREILQRIETEKLFGKKQEVKKDDYASRNLLQAKVLTLGEWKRAK